MNILELPQAKDCFSGILNLARRDGGWMPERFTARQFAYHAAAGEGRRIRTECAAGVVLRFVTDSPWLDLEFECLGGARGYLGIDVEVDGRVVYTFRAEKYEGIFCQRLVDFGSGVPRRREITVYFCAATIALLKNVGVVEGSRVEAAPVRPRRLLCLGDSITQGMSAISPLSTCPIQLARLLDAELLNQGIGGHVFDVDSLDDTPGFEPDWITVAYGTNDWSRGMNRAQVQASAFAYVARLRALFPTVPIWILSPLWRSNASQPAGGGLDLAAFGEAIRDAVISTPGVDAVDGFSLIPHDAFYFVDGLHPNELGFLHYAVNLYRACEWNG